MKRTKLALILMIIITATMLVGIFNVSYAASGNRYLSIRKLRASGFGYEALGKQIWKICESNSSGTTVNYDHTIYCLKGGPGFGSSSFGSGEVETRPYTKYFNMKNPSEITGNYENAIPSKTSSTYKSLVWLLDNVYVAPSQNPETEERLAAAEYREILLNKAGIVDGYITDDDIDAVQQLAVWHFTNNDEYKVETGSEYGTFEFWVNAVAKSDTNYNPLSDEVGAGGLYGENRAAECQRLYNYLVNTAEAMGTSSSYTIAEANRPYALDKNLVVKHNTVGGNHIVGPFKINQISQTAGKLTGTFKNGNTTIYPTALQDKAGNRFNTLDETVGKEFYIVIPSSTNIEKINFTINVSYFKTTINYWSVDEAPAADQPVAEVTRVREKYSDEVNYTPVVEEEKRFDLALRKFITAVGDNPLVDEDGEYLREPIITPQTLKDLADKKIKTAVKTHPKTNVLVETNQIVTYTIRVYNEGQVDGFVKEITDYLPEGLEFAKGTEINNANGWKMYDKDGNETTDPTKGKTIKTDKLAGTELKAFDGTTLKYLDVQIQCKVVATVKNQDTILKNIAEITAHSDKEGNMTVKDDDSDPKNVNKDNYGTTSQEDDDDFEPLVLIGKYFDLSLRKFITAIENSEGNTELIDKTGKYIREPDVDVSPLLNGKTTANYNHPKKALNVDVGNIVTYTIRVYNEGQINGYVHEITDHLPEWLEFVINDELNARYGWKVSGDGRTVTTNITTPAPKTADTPDIENAANRDLIYANRREDRDKVLLKAFDVTGTSLDYIDVKIRCRVKDSGITEKITNIAEITKSSDVNNSGITDRDNKSKVTLPKDEALPEYKETEINRGDKYIEGNEDDDDFEKVMIQKFDLALRKFITAVDDKKISGRTPVFSMDSKGKMTYSHPKTPVDVMNGNIVTYTLRIYNEGNQAGYAEEIKDNIPEGLEYLPDHATNKTYRWKMYNKDGIETSNVKEAVTIRTDYLSKAQGEADKRDNLIKAFDKKTMTQPAFKEVEVAFQVTEPNTSDRILINIAEITDDADEDGKPVDDIDSTPDNNEEKEDDIDIEKVKVKYFDLALEKIITEYSLTKNGKTTVTKTGHKFGVQPEPIVKIEMITKTRKTATLKFKYQIKVTNEGEIPGYATEVKDYIPEGLKFVEKDNKKWKLSEDGKTVTTDQLKDTLLKPGESAVVEIVLQWINGEDNLGLKQNWAEISKDKNDSNTPDIDSTPDNNKRGEDDIDDASVILLVVTGAEDNYIFIAGGILAILTTGVVLIKKFVI